jgi:dTDP-4-amino-4,6-dideoxygalactose transaminase
MNEPIPFLRPRLVTVDDYLPYLRTIDQSRQYTNFGPLNTKFEQRMLAEWFGNEGAVCTMGNATLGLMLAIDRIKRRGRYAIMPSFTFAATPLAAQWCGLEPIFVDIDPDQWVLDPAALDRALKTYGDEVAVVVTYATCGSFMDLGPYEQLMKRGIPVVVDAASSIGATHEGKSFGQGFSGAVVYSMHATKAFPVGEGCLVHSGNKDLVAKIRKASNFGFGAARASEMLSMNAKLPEISAAVALATLDSFSARRNKLIGLHAEYGSQFKSAGLIEAGFRPQAVRGTVSPQWFAVCAPNLSIQQQCVKDAAARGIEFRRYFTPACHMQPQFSASPNDGLAITNQLCEGVMSLPLWVEMNERIIKRVVDSVCATVTANQECVR